MKRPVENTLYGLTGYPLGHSYSKTFFTEKFRAEGLEAEYRNYPLKELTRDSVVRLAQENPNLRGLNVTSPHKQAAYALADVRTEEAEAAGAANTLRITHIESGDGVLIEAHNTDIEGFRESLRPYISGGASQRQAFICGSGGAAQAVRIALEQLGIKSTFVSRNPEMQKGAIGYDEVSDRLEPFDIIVNATPLGTAPRTDEFLPLPYDKLGQGNIFADLVYNPAETTMMQLSSRSGARTLNGLQMLELQAIASYKFWNKL